MYTKHGEYSFVGTEKSFETTERICGNRGLEDIWNTFGDTVQTSMESERFYREDWCSRVLLGVFEVGDRYSRSKKKREVEQKAHKLPISKDRYKQSKEQETQKGLQDFANLASSLFPNGPALMGTLDPLLNRSTDSYELVGGEEENYYSGDEAHS